MVVTALMEINRLIVSCNICMGSGDVGLCRLASKNTYDDFCLKENSNLHWHKSLYSV